MPSASRSQRWWKAAWISSFWKPSDISRRFTKRCSRPGTSILPFPIVAQVTIDEDGNCLDGSDPETFAPKLAEWGADVIGCNCSVGPVAMLDAMERVRAATSLPLAAQPNAGIPRSVDGRNIYLCSPEYMASYARKFVAAGVRLVGGCCGTTPEHIRVMKAALRVGEARGKDASAHTGASQSSPRRRSRCATGEALAAGRETGCR